MAQRLILGLIAALFVSLTFGGSLAAAPADTAFENASKINIADRQRMLSQRIAQAACFAALGVDVAAHMAMAQKAHSEFDTGLKALRHGSTDLGISGETNADILAALDDVELPWKDFGSAVASTFLADDFELWVLGAINANRLELLQEMNEAVTKFVQAYSNAGIAKTRAETIIVAGRQRMLTQKAAAEFCLVIQGEAGAQNRALLRDTVDLFDTSLSSLMAGNDGMVPPRRQISAQLKTVENLWSPLAAIYYRIADGALPTKAEIDLVAKQTELLLAETNRAVGMY